MMFFDLIENGLTLIPCYIFKANLNVYQIKRKGCTHSMTPPLLLNIYLGSIPQMCVS